MNKKIFAILSLAIVAIVCAGAASAFDLGSLTGSDSDADTVTIEGVDFNIPKGFKEDPNHEIVNEKNSVAGVEYTSNGKLYEKGNDIFIVMVAEYDGYEVTDEIVEYMGGEKETVNGVDGYITTDDNYYVFSYPKDGKLVAVSTTNETLFEDIIIK